MGEKLNFNRSYWMDFEESETLDELSVIPVDQAVEKELDIGLASVKKLIAFLQFKCLTTKACGYAAPQFGFKNKVFVVFFKGKFFNFINPKIIHLNPISQEDDVAMVEGCMSLPGEKYLVQRRNKITIVPFEDCPPKVFCGMLSRIVQHELDHLDNKFISQIGIRI